VEYPYREQKKGRSWFWTALDILLTFLLGIFLYVFVMDLIEHMNIPASPFVLLLFKAILHLIVR